MRVLGALLLFILVACGSSNNPGLGNAPLLPDDAINVAWFANAQPNVDVVALSIDPSILADLAAYEDDGCYSDSTTPSPLNANVTAYTLTRTYTNCNGALSNTVGHRTVNANTIVADSMMTLNSNLVMAFAQEMGMLSLVSNTNVTVNGNTTAGIQRTYTTSRTWANSTSSNSQTFNNTMTIADAYNPNTLLPTQSTINGAFSSAYSTSTQDYSVTYTNIVMERTACCIPISGSIVEAETFNDGSKETNTWAFTSPCGSFTVNGQPFSITDCP